jgi:hypothetical protein
MYDKNVQEILLQIKKEDIVLDVGGWFRPFNRANWIIDFMPYETRGAGGSDGPEREYFTKETWIQRDICDRQRFPFRDKEIDFVICSHTLEDVRDPIFVCSEICRIAKKGYIETPSKITELSYGIESRHYAGYHHHRWIVEIKDNKIYFLVKPSFINAYWKYHFPAFYGRYLKEEGRIQYLFWKDSFEYEEINLIDCGELMNKIETLVSSVHIYRGYRYQIEKLKDLLRKKINF